ncbi:hypothetical protein LAB1_12180 [Roseibium sp. LAB1]
MEPFRIFSKLRSTQKIYKAKQQPHVGASVRKGVMSGVFACSLDAPEDSGKFAEKTLKGLPEIRLKNIFAPRFPDKFPP